MVRQRIVLLGVGLAWALLTLSCGVVNFSSQVQVTAVVIGPGTPLPSLPLPNLAPTPALPVLLLAAGGQRVAASQQTYVWSSASGGAASTAGTGPLIVTRGAALDVIVNYRLPPAALWVAELDAQDVPVTTMFLKPAAASAYTPSRSGRYRLQVTAEWTAQTVLTAIFDLDVQP